MYSKEWTIKSFLANNPEYSYLKAFNKTFQDKRYRVRTLHDNNNRILQIEIGFESDNWYIMKPKILNNPYKPTRR